MLLLLATRAPIPRAFAPLRHGRSKYFGTSSIQEVVANNPLVNSSAAVSVPSTSALVDDPATANASATSTLVNNDFDG